jgi:hypothetical protein
MFNIGPGNEVNQQRLGLLPCLACVHSHSPFANKNSREEFEKLYRERCSHQVKPTWFYADVEGDVLDLHDVEARTISFSVVEAVLMSPARVLDIEDEDLQLLDLGHIGQDRVDVLLYDPIPGGSGLLEHVSERWEEVRTTALSLLEGCVSACESSSIDCLQTYWDRWYHEHLNRHKAGEIPRSAMGPLVKAHDIPEHLPAVGGIGPQPPVEVCIKRFLSEAGLPAPICQHTIAQGVGYGSTIGDFFYNGDDDEPGICIYLEGMAGHIHGNPEQAAKDDAIRSKLDSLGYEVITVRSFELDDKDAVVGANAKIAARLVGKEKQKELRKDIVWFDRVLAAPAPSRSRTHLRLTRREREVIGAVPIYDLRIAAGAFSEGQSSEATGYGRVEGSAPRRDLFVAQVVGYSMDKVAPKRAWCLWNYLRNPGVAVAAPGDELVVRLPDGADAEMGRFTFKRLMQGERGRALRPVSSNPEHREIPLGDSDEIEAVARFLGVVDQGEGEQ